MHRSRESRRNPERSATSAHSGAGSLPGEFLLNAARKDGASGDAATTVLVVEDDRAVRELFTRILEGAGYAVIACENGASGLEAARHQIDTIGAVVTDAKMPGMSGQKLIARIRALRPGLPAILVSGAAIDGVADANTVFLTKPVSPEMLTRELQRLLCGTM